MKLSWLAGLVGLGEDAQDEKVATALESRVTLAKGLESEVVALKASLEQASTQAKALEARATQAESARDAALLALESIPPAPAAPEPAPAATAKYKPGDKVMYREKEMPIMAAMGPEMVYEFEGGECGPESRCQPMNSPVAVAFKSHLELLSTVAKQAAGHTITPEGFRSMAMAMANNEQTAAEAVAKIYASVPSNAQRQAVARGVLEALAPAVTAKPVAGTSDRQAKIRNRVYGGN